LNCLNTNWKLLRERERERERTCVTVGIELSSVNLVPCLISASISNPSSLNKFRYGSKTALELQRILAVNYGMRIEIDPIIHSIVKKNVFYCPRKHDRLRYICISRCEICISGKYNIYAIYCNHCFIHVHIVAQSLRNVFLINPLDRNFL